MISKSNLLNKMVFCFYAISKSKLWNKNASFSSNTRSDVNWLKTNVLKGGFFKQTSPPA